MKQLLVKTIQHKISIVICIIFLYPCITFGAETDDALQQVKNYIQSIKSVAIEFDQIDAKNNTASGILIIDKPYKFRCNYYPPYPIVIIGNKNYVSLYDYEMEQLSRIKYRDNIFYSLLEDNMDLDNKFNVISAEKVKRGYKLRVHNSDLNRTSEITFDENTGHINLIKIFEDNNTITLIVKNVQKIKNIKEDLFIIQNPDIFGSPKRYDHISIKKQYQTMQ